jgi:alpha-galactosidase
MHPHLWTNDPDCLLARERETELSREEVQALATAIGLTGGMTLISDPVARLPLDRLNLVSRLLPPLRERALPASYFEVGIPERVVARLDRPWGTWWLVGLFNSAAVSRELRVAWSDLQLEPGGYHAAEFWTGNYLGVSHEGAAVTVPAHGAAVLAVRAESEDPLLLSTSFHISQGGVEIASWDYERHTERLRWTVELGRHAAGTLTLWVPPKLTPSRLVSTARVAHWRRNQGGEILVDAEISGHADFALELERR